ncbi:vitamin K epoxide reductase family protein [Patescibacteria group bacterium]|nr:vitamin K epoxide reductase family protein [Patescibacteria group bacterium]
MPLNKTNKILLGLFIATATLGFLDSVYLTTKYFVGTINCSALSGCQEVLNSAYSNIWGIPTASFGVAYYLSIIIASLIYWQIQQKYSFKYLTLIPSLGFLFTLWLIYLQIWVIGFICIYCMFSALSSTILFVLSLYFYHLNKKTTKPETL